MHLFANARPNLRLQPARVYPHIHNMITNSQPMRADQALFNEVGALEFQDFQEHVRYAFRLGGEVRKDPSNPILRVALAMALIHSGRRNEGRDQLFYAQGLMDWSDVTLTAAISTLLSGIGETQAAERGLSRLAHMIGVDPAITANALLHALGYGDLSRLPLIAENKGLVASRSPGFVSCCELLAETGLLEHLQNHQSIVQRHVAAHQCWIGITFSSAAYDFSGGTAFMEHWVTLDAAQCLEASRHIAEDLYSYYESQGSAPGRWVGIFQPMLMPVGGAA